MFGLQFRIGVCETVVLLLSSAVHKVRFIIHCTTFIATHALLVITIPGCLSVVNSPAGFDLNVIKTVVKVYNKGTRHTGYIIIFI